MTWKLRKQKVRDKSTGEYKRVRENPIRETSWKHDRLKVPKLGEVKIYMHRYDDYSTPRWRFCRSETLSHILASATFVKRPFSKSTL